eukprot:TRINITY_DN2971_c0_g2_i1.p1 TRINITY_DN2971_c0_g2~~TRINITY_DN2971_c0_g2_i1.p1  ORF type:complete len:680 (-),score=136.11 TRINITY_DN2971_c0_g2_i1:47-2050(-)
MATSDLKEDSLLATSAEDEDASPEAKGTSAFDASKQWAMFVFTCIVFTALCVGGAMVSWHLGITLCFFFLFFAAGLAVNIEHAGIWREISRPLWVLVCLLVACFFTWLSICVVGGWEGQEQTLRKDQSRVQSVFEWPNDLKGWVAYQSTEAGSSHTVFKGLAFFGGSTGDKLLMRTMSPTNATTETVQPGMSDAHSFTDFKGDLYFFARKSVKDQGEQLWSIRGAQPTGTAVLVKSFADQEIPRSPVVWNQQLFFKVYTSCGSFKTWTHYRSDGTAQGTVDENSGKLYSNLLKACSSATSGTEMRPPRSRLYGVLFLAVMPSTVLALILLYLLRTPGVVLNILGGVYAFAMVIYILVVDDLAGLKNVFEFSALLYASCGYGLFGIIKLQAVNLPEWLAELTDWALIGLSVAFFGAINLILDMPNATDGWKWAVYAAVQLALVLLGLLVKLALPVVLAGVGLMVIAYKAAFEGVEGANTGLGPQMKLALQLSGTLVLGLLVLAAGTFYAFHKKLLETRIAKLILGGTEEDGQPEGQLEEAGKKEAWPAKTQQGDSPGGAAVGSQNTADAPDLGSRGLAAPKAEHGETAPPVKPSAEDIESLKQLQQLKFHDILKLQTKLLSSSKGLAKPQEKETHVGSTTVEGLHAPAEDLSLNTFEGKEGDTSEEEC